MSATNLILSKPSKKQVLQQSNSNFEVSHVKNDNYKVMLARSEDDVSQETENQFDSTKIFDRNQKPDVKKLKNIRVDISSPKRGAIQKADVGLRIPSEYSSDESSEEELKRRRKMRPVVPNYVTNTDSGPCRKPRQSRQNSTVLSSQTSPRIPKAQPLSIARRNARERNRVKQVNEGFATLRNRIPDYISEAYNEEKGRRSAKKLSKVETLRMAVDYIRHLETLLDIRSTENEPWNTPNSPADDYPESVDIKFQPSSPVPLCEQTNFEYQDRVFYEYDLDFLNRKESYIPEKRPQMYTVLTVTGSDSVDDFKYYESFNKLKKENCENGSDDNVEDESQDSENLLTLEKEPEVPVALKPKDVIKKFSNKTVLPSITESFNKGVAVFF